MTVELIKKNFYYGGFKFCQFFFTEHYYCYGKYLNDELIGYEVFERRILENNFINGRPYRRREAFPKDEDFGVFAWAYGCLGLAIRKCTSK